MFARLLFTVVFACTLTLMGCGGEQASNPEDIAAAFEEWELKFAGDAVPITDEALAALPVGITELKIYDANPVTDAGMAYLAKQTNLTSLRFDNCTFSDQGLKHIGGLTKLESLQFSNNEITDDGLAILASLPNLTTISIHGEKLTEQWLDHTTHLDLTSFLYSFKLTDAGLEHIGRFTRLEEIYLEFDGDQVTDKGGVHLGKLKELKSLFLDDCKIGNGTLEAIKDLPKLKKLRILRCPNVTHEGLRHLASLPALEELNLIYNDMSGPGLADLQNAPKLKKMRITHITPENAKYLGEVTQLEELSFMEANVGDDVLRPIAHLTNLKTLDLASTNIESIEPVSNLTGLTTLHMTESITEEGFKGVSKLVNLEELYVGRKLNSMEPIRSLKKLKRLSVGQNTDDDCVEIISGLTNLEWVTLAGSKVTEAGYKKIKAALPNATVASDFE